MDEEDCLAVVGSDLEVFSSRMDVVDVEVVTQDEREGARADMFCFLIVSEEEGL